MSLAIGLGGVLLGLYFFTINKYAAIGITYFALMEIQMVLMRMYKNFQFELASNKPMEFTPLVTLKPKQSIELNLIRR